MSAPVLQPLAAPASETWRGFIHVDVVAWRTSPAEPDDRLVVLHEPELLPTARRRRVENRARSTPSIHAKRVMTGHPGAG